MSYVSARYVGLGERLFGDGYVVTADFTESGGIFTNAEVTYRGVAVGRVDRLRLADDGVHVDLRLQGGTRIPADTRAVVANRSAVGEQYVDLQPRRRSGPYLSNGGHITVANTATPIHTETRLLQASTEIPVQNPPNQAVKYFFPVSTGLTESSGGRVVVRRRIRPHQRTRLRLRAGTSCVRGRPAVRHKLSVRTRGNGYCSAHSASRPPAGGAADSPGAAPPGVRGACGAHRGRADRRRRPRARISSASSRNIQRADVLQAARQETVNFTTLDYRHLDRDLGRVLRGSTGDFRKQFQAGTKNLTQLVTANKAVAKGDVLDAGLVSSDSDSAVVLVVADSTVTNTASPKGEQRHYRLQLSLVRQQGHWLVSDLTFVG